MRSTLPALPPPISMGGKLLVLDLHTKCLRWGQVGSWCSYETGPEPGQDQSQTHSLLPCLHLLSEASAPSLFPTYCQVKLSSSRKTARERSGRADGKGAS